MKDDNYALAIGAMVWGLGSVIGLIGGVVTERWGITIAAFGSIVMMIGIAGIIQSRNMGQYHNAMLFFPFIGGAVMLGGIAFQLCGEAFIQKYSPAVMMGAFFVLGAILIVYPRIENARKRNRCTVPVNALCVSVATRRDEDSTSYCPTYEIYYAGQTIRLCDNLYTNFENYRVGDYKELLINPNDPKEFYNETVSKKKTTLALIIGVVLLIAAASIFLSVFVGI